LIALSAFFYDAETLTALGMQEQHTQIFHITRHNVRQRTHIVRLGGRTDFIARPNGNDAKGRATFHAFSHHIDVTCLEHAQGQNTARE
jgi:hypothetical protein